MPSASYDPPITYEPTQPQWLFTRTEFNTLTPSRAEGIPLETELLNRRKGINFITQVGISLKLDQITLATAAIYFQRFYMRHPLHIHNKGAHHYQVAATSVYVAYKSKENPRKMHELIVAVSRVAQKDPNLMIDEQSKEFWRWRETIQSMENLMLEVLCFDLDPGLPYSVLYEMLKYFSAQEHKPLRNISWSIVNDSFSTPVCLFVQPQSVAGAAFFMALKHLDQGIPDENRRAWWEVLGLDVDEMKMVMEMMVETYSTQGVRGQAGPEVYTESEGFHVTRRPGTPSEGGGTPFGDVSQNGNGNGNGHESGKEDDGNASEEGELS